MNFTPICIGCGIMKRQKAYESKKVWLRRRFCSHPCSLEFNKRNRIGFFGTWSSGKFHDTGPMIQNVERVISNALPHD